MKRSALVALLLGFAGIAIVAGCGGGGSSTAAPGVPAASTSQKVAPATLRIVIPPKTTSSSSRKPAYVSPATQSVSISVAGSTAQVVNLTGGACTPSGGTQTCTATFALPVGVDESAAVSTFASTDGSGAALSINTVPITIVISTANTINISLNGVVASYGLTISPTAMPVLTNGTFTATYTAYDASGDAIVGPGSLVDSTNTPVSPTLTSNDSSGATSIGALSGNTWAIIETDQKGSAVQFTVASGGSPTPTSAIASFATTPDIQNTTFEGNTLTPWFPCYAAHAALASSVNPVPNPQVSPEVLQSPSTTIGQTLINPSTDVTLQTTVPQGSVEGTYSAMVGNDTSTKNASNYLRDKGLVGMCQTIVVPQNNPTLTLDVYEGGNVATIAGSDAEVDIFPSGTTFTPSALPTPTGGFLANASPAPPLMAEANCFNNLNTSGGSLSSGVCATPSPVAANEPGGQWRTRGPFSLSAYAGLTVTLDLGLWSASSSTGYYDYVLWDNIVLTGT